MLDIFLSVALTNRGTSNDKAKIRNALFYFQITYVQLKTECKKSQLEKSIDYRHVTFFINCNQKSF